MNNLDATPLTTGNADALGGKSGTRQARLPSFDGWRAVSIALVLMSHYEIFTGFLRGGAGGFVESLGDLGVRFFFTISGFLITWLLLGEFERTGSVSLKNFYIRRAFRILPVYVAFLAVLFLLQAAASYHQNVGQWLANLTFTTNYVPPPWPAAHLWSLAVEEQFYLLWPALLVGLGLAVNFRRALTILAVPFVVAPIFRIMAYKGYYPGGLTFLFEHSSFFRYFDTLAIGCGCAIIAFTNRDSARAALEKWSRWIPPIAVIALVTPMFFNEARVPGRVQEAAGYTFQACGFALLLMQSVFFPQLKGYRWLNWGWVRHLGVLSYSIYIWQQILATNPKMFGFKDHHWMSSPFWWVAVVAAAHVSYYGLERPFLKVREAYRGRKPGARGAGAVGAGDGGRSEIIQVAAD